LTQALVDLALNGIQAMESGGELGISVRHVDDDIRLSVTDNGHGILPGQVEQIFKPFHTTKHKGTGLGLAITRGIVERHGGHIEVESEPGEGSTFTLVISAAPQEVVAQ
jgi:two-component system sensor histidine kinase HydH